MPQWEELKEVLADLLDLDPEERERLLQAAEVPPEIEVEVKGLLALAQKMPESFLETVGEEGGIVIGGRYEIIRQLARSSLSVVYLARDAKLLNKTVAVKVYLGDGRTRERQALAKVTHPGIVRILDAGDCPQFGRFIALEYLEGETLRQRLVRERLPFPAARTFVSEIAEALTTAHAAGILHRDLKPENVILVNESGTERAKLIDFGTARVEHPANGTSTTVLGGTLGYLAPEQLVGKPSPLSDLYSLAVIAYEMIAGIHPYLAQKDGCPEHPSRLSPDLPKVAGDVLLRALDYRPEGRPRNVREFIDAFEGALEGPGSKRKAAAVALGALLICGLCTAAWFFAQSRFNSPSHPIRLRNMVLLTSPDELAVDPAGSADGRWVAYSSDRAGNGILNIWVRSNTTGESRQLTNDSVGASDPAISPDGLQVVYRSAQDGGLYRIAISGGRTQKIAHSGRRPRFSPSGLYLAYWDGEPGGGPGTVYVTSSLSSNASQVNRTCGNAAAYPVWSEDSERLLIWCIESGAGANERADLWMVGVEPGVAVKTGLSARLAKQRLRGLPPSNGFEPLAWTHGQVLFAAAGPTGADLWEIGLNPKTGKVEGDARRLTEAVPWTRQAFAGSNRKLIFSTLNEDVQVWSLRLGSKRPEKLTSVSRRDVRPSMTPDGKKIAFVATSPNGRHAVWTKSLMDGRLGKISGDMDATMAPQLSRDGTKIVFSTENAAQRTIWWVSTNTGEGPNVTRKLCEGCGLPLDIMPDNSYVLTDANYDGGARLPGLFMSMVEIPSGVSHLSKTPVYSNYVRISPDGRWMACVAYPRGDSSQIFISPMKHSGGRLKFVDEQNWIAATQADAKNSLAAWSPDGLTLYYVSDRDGFRCIWGQRLDSETKRPVGEPFAVYHSHNARLSLSNVGHIWANGLSAATDRVVFSQGERKGAIWMADIER